MRHRHWSLSLIGWGFVFTLLLSACTAPTHPTNQPADPSLAHLQTCELANLQTPKLANLHQAADNYARYHALAPDDLLGLKRLTGVCAALEQAGVEDESCREAASQGSGPKSNVGRGTSSLKPETSPAAILGEVLETRTDDRHIVAELLGVSMESVELGPNLVEDGGFEEWMGGRPSRWMWWTMFNRNPYNAAAFAAGGDGLLPFEGRAVARVDGFWVQQREDKSPARAGFWQWDELEQNLRPITLTTRGPYVFSFHYRTTRVPEGGARVWVSDDPDVLWAGYHGLPATDGAWHHFVAVGWNRAGTERAIYPLFSSFAPGSVAYDNVQLRPVELSTEATVAISEARFWVTAGDHQ